MNRFLPQNFMPRLKRFLLNESQPLMKEVKIGNVSVSRLHPRFFVAEIGINHNGDINIAKKLIDAAVNAGAQAVKFQKRTIPVVYTSEELAKPREVDRSVLENAVKRGVLSKEAVERLQKSDFKNSTNGDLKWALEFTKSEYQEIDRYCKEKGILWFASPWDEGSLDFLEQFDVPCHKVASACLTYDNLLKKMRSTGKPVVISTGMSTMEQVNKAVNILGGENMVLMHTVSTYPAKEEDINIRTISKYRKLFPKTPIGYSGHEKGIGVSIGAAMSGASMIERHITLDKKMFGTDQSASLEPHEFASLISSVREMEKAVGDGVKRVLPAEVPIMEKLRKS